MAAKPSSEELASLVSAQTTVRLPPEEDPAAHVAVLRDMRHRAANRDLALLYTRAVDDYDVDAVVELFTADGVFERRGEPAAGREALRSAYATAMRVNRTMVHTLDSHVVQLLPRGLGQVERIRWPGATAGAADHPEQLRTWQAFQAPGQD